MLLPTAHVLAGTTKRIKIRRRDFLAGLSLAATMPGAQAQQPEKVHRIAFVNPAMPLSVMMEIRAGQTAVGSRYWEKWPPTILGTMLGRLRELGYSEETNLVVARYSGEGRTERYGELARGVVGSKPDVIIAMSTRMVRHFKEATTTIPIVGSMVDPIAQGLATSLAHPGGNITGVVFDAGIGTYEGKRLEVLREAVPSASRVGFLAPRAVWENPDGAAFREIAQQRGIQIVGALLETPIQESEYRRVFATMAQEHVDALIVSDASENGVHGRAIVELAEEHRLPTVYPVSGFVKAGGLISWGVDYVNPGRRVGDIVAQILQGAKPGDIPFYRADRVELAINLRTAKALGIEMPVALLARADEVIE
jgi:putative ABC transport system substrate-binding protein